MTLYSHPSLKLNEAQSRAVLSDARQVLIIAGPGTGKTHTLTHRIVRFAKKLQHSKNILAITFTNQAAQEMRKRLTQNLGSEILNISIGTLHQFCLKILRHDFGLDDFQIAGPDTLDDIFKVLWKDGTLKERRVAFETISLYKADAIHQPPRLFDAYQKALRERKLFDFDDMLWELKKLLQSNQEMVKHIQGLYPYIFVDEYQDINPLQHALIKIIAGQENHLTVIGDPNQAIYGFRGCDPLLFTRFQEDFPQVEKIELTKNYRSAENLLEASSQIIEKSGFLSIPPLVAQIYKKGELIVYAALSEKAEAEYIVHQVEVLVGGTSFFSKDSGRVSGQEIGQYSFSDIAVLYRLNRQAKSIQKAFERSGIPYQACGYDRMARKKETAQIIEDMRSLNMRHIQDVLDFLKKKENQFSYVDSSILWHWAQSADTPQDFFDHVLLEESREEFHPCAEKVSFLTMHASKGMEFRAVFIPGCEQGLVPLDAPTDLNEERRLFYVAMTRAKERVYLLHAAKRVRYGKKYSPQPSIFLKDIQQELKAYEAQVLKRSKKPKDDQITLFGL